MGGFLDIESSILSHVKLPILCVLWSDMCSFLKLSKLALRVAFFFFLSCEFDCYSVLQATVAVQAESFRWHDSL